VDSRREGKVTGLSRPADVGVRVATHIQRHGGLNLAIHPEAPWHQESYDTFVSEGLPRLIGDRIPVTAYEWAHISPKSCRVTIRVGEAEIVEDLPRPDASGVFDLRDTPVGDNGFRVVIPVPNRLDVAEATIAYVGEQLAAYLTDRLGTAPEGVDWDQELLSSWLPLSEWVYAFLASEPTSQYLQNTNWLDRWTHIRRLTLIPTVPEGEAVLDEDSVGRSYAFGLTCPINAPSGPNAGWFLEVALGAAIKEGRLVRVAEDGGRSWIWD